MIMVWIHPEMMMMMMMTIKLWCLHPERGDSQEVGLRRSTRLKFSKGKKTRHADWCFKMMMMIADLYFKMVMMIADLYSRWWWWLLIVVLGWWWLLLIYISRWWWWLLIDVLRWWWLLMNILQNNDEVWWFWSWSLWELIILEIDVPPFPGYNNDPDNHFKVTMTQTYTKQFQCEYKLQRYPFDTQVTIIIIVVSSANISWLPFRFLSLDSYCKCETYLFRSARLRWQWTLYHRLQSN